MHMVYGMPHGKRYARRKMNTHALESRQQLLLHVLRHDRQARQCVVQGQHPLVLANTHATALQHCRRRGGIDGALGCVRV